MKDELELLDYIKERERKIAKSNIRLYFTPHTPVQRASLLKGRDWEYAHLMEQLNTPGLHAMLYGERGVGKSSLANVVAIELANVTNRKLFKKSCVSCDEFATIVELPLREVGVDIYNTGKINGPLNITLPSLSVLNGNTSQEAGTCTRAISPSWVVNKIKDINGILLVDEFDAITSDVEKKKMAELIKLLSDCDSKLKILIVGVAQTSSELTTGHPSIGRCLREIKLGRIKIADLSKIIKEGARQAGLVFEPLAISRIIFVSSGYPYFTHLLALKASEDAIAEGRTTISVKNVVDATAKAVESAEETLKSVYDKSVLYINKEEYERILLAAAKCREEGFSTTDLKNSYFELVKEPLNSSKLSSYLSKVVANDNSLILRRLCKGRYRFSDPRMPSFIKIARAFLE